MALLQPCNYEAQLFSHSRLSRVATHLRLLGFELLIDLISQVSQRFIHLLVNLLVLGFLLLERIIERFDLFKLLGKSRFKLFHSTIILLKVELDAVDLPIVFLETITKVIQCCLALVLMLIGDFADFFAHGLVDVSGGI